MELPSQSDLVCLYLDAVDTRAGTDATGEESTSAPTEAPPRTVQGIARVLELDRDTTAQRVTLLSTLESLTTDGLVAREEVSADGTTRPRYRLTESGQRHASALREQLRDETVTVSNGTTETVTIEELDRYFETYPLVRALTRLTDDGTIRLWETVGGEFVDREAELERLQETLSTVTQQGSRTVLVSGEAGLGKTTLVERLLEQARNEGFCVATGRCRREGGRPYEPLLDALSALPDSDPLVSPLESAAYEVTDPESLDAQRTALFNEVADGIRERSERQPLVVFLDDLQWAGTDTQQLFAHLTQAVTEWIYPVLFVATHRSESLATDDETVAEMLAGDRTEQLELGPLPRADSHGLVAWLTNTPDLPSEFLGALREQAGGNPLLLRETVQQLVDTGVLAPGEQDPDAVPTTPEEFPIPNDVATVIESRLETLPAATRAVLEATAVADETATPALVAAVVDGSEGTVNDHLDVLVTGQFLRRTTDGVAFVGGVVREVIVEQLSADRRSQLHSAVAAAIESVASDTDDDLAARIAHHYEAAGNAETALTYYQQAGDRSTEVYAHEDASSTYERALSVARDIDDESAILSVLEALGDTTTTLGRYETAREYFETARRECDDAVVRQRLYRKTGETFNSQGDFEAAIEAAATGLALTETDDDTGGRDASAEVAGLLSVKARALRETGEREEARETARRACERAQAAGEPEHEALALRHLGNVAQAQGAYDEAADHLEASLELAREQGDQTKESHTLKSLGNVSVRRGDLDTAEEYYRDGLAISREIGDRQSESGNLHNLGFVAETRGSLDDAADYYEQSLAIDRDVGDRQGEAHTLQSLGRVASDRGELDTAVEYYEQSLATQSETGNRRGEATCLYNLGDVTRERGEIAAAEEYYERCLSIYREIGDRQGASASLHGLGFVAETRGNLDSATESYEQSLDIQREIGYRQGAASTLNSLGRIAFRRGNADTAEAKFDESLAMRREIGDRRDEAETLMELGTMALEQWTLDTATEYFEESLAIQQEIGYRFGQATTLSRLGEVAIRRGEFDAAESTLDESLELAGEVGAVEEESAARIARGKLALERGRCDSARTDIEAGLTVARDIECRVNEIEALIARGKLAREEGDLEAATAALEDALTLARESGYRLKTLDVLALLADVHEQADDPAAAREDCETALSVLAACEGTFEARESQFQKRLATLDGAEQGE